MLEKDKIELDFIHGMTVDKGHNAIQSYARHKGSLVKSLKSFLTIFFLYDLIAIKTTWIHHKFVLLLKFQDHVTTYRFC